MKNKNRWFRYSLQIFFFVLIGMIAVNHALSESGVTIFPFLPNVSLHAICPFGGIASIIELITAGTLVPKLQLSTLVISGLILILTLIFGAVFCSFVCPLGTIQEWVGKLGKKIFKKQYNTFIPQKLHNIFKYLRYVVLILTVILTFNASRLIFADVDPYYAMYHFFTDEVTIGSLVVLAVVLLSSLFIERPWCKYACPYGAFLGLVGKISIFKIKRKTSTCNHCTLCDKKCPMNIEISKKETIGDTHCIRCMNCVEDGVCSKDSLVYTSKKVNFKEEVTELKDGGVK
ncbi:MAG: 4Fe-4S binding protein [Clostridiales bacterium]|nr:4Fe-4S binding protein [Clostridiales bacterium]